MAGQTTVAERYARAIFALGVENGTLPALADEIQSFASAYEESLDLRSVLENPLLSHEQRQKVLSEVASRLGLGRLARNSINYLAARRRLTALPDIAEQLRALSDEQQGVLRAIVTTATRMPESFYERLSNQLTTLVGRKILLDRREDPTLIAGTITRIGDNTIDASLRGQLETLERRLLAS